ncbi:hypothetical protein [Massilia sp. NR 4-1]|uniref:hypothetical protein n=1 Tax=Massilia sp. NR 4-1 TaxID=1678028 RepID=UPI00067DF224|nr:hypothetical protein [Massilia sp. NR 4-1]AKU23420.1 hypothetical protein ACZ75_20115 [Massilia sp. NR 4-1]
MHWNTDDARAARNWPWLGAIALLHLAVLLAWRPTMQLRAPQAVIWAQPLGMGLMRPPPDLAPAPVAPPKPRPPESSARASRPETAGRASTAAVPADTAPPASAPAPAITVPALPGEAAPSVALPADPFAQPAAPAETLAERARRAAAGIDKQLRKESLNAADRAPPHEPELARKIGEAYKERSFGIVWEKRFPNGEVLAKIRTPIYTYCIRLKRRYDGTEQTFMVTCPN